MPNTQMHEGKLQALLGTVLGKIKHPWVAIWGPRTRGDPHLRIGPGSSSTPPDAVAESVVNVWQVLGYMKDGDPAGFQSFLTFVAAVLRDRDTSDPPPAYDLMKVDAEGVKVARPAIDKEIRSKYINLIRSGVPFDTAAEVLKLGPRTVAAWRKEHTDFGVEVSQARALWTVEKQEQMRAAGVDDWKMHEADLQRHGGREFLPAKEKAQEAEWLNKLVAEFGHRTKDATTLTRILRCLSVETSMADMIDITPTDEPEPIMLPAPTGGPPDDVAQ